jgi:hypothetical protein
MIRAIENEKDEISHLSANTDGNHGLSWGVSEGDMFSYHVNRYVIEDSTSDTASFKVLITIDDLPEIPETITVSSPVDIDSTITFDIPRPNVTIAFDNGTDCHDLELPFIVLPIGNWSLYTELVDEEWGTSSLEWLSDTTYWGFDHTVGWFFGWVTNNTVYSFQFRRADGVLHSSDTRVRVSTRGKFTMRKEYTMHHIPCNTPCLLDRIDRDADNLSNHQESLIGTDPFDNDTDSDLMPDGWEYYCQLNPLVDDSLGDPDHDDLSNLGEYLHDADPHDSDTDSDSIPDGLEVHTYGTLPNNEDTENDLMPDGWEVLYGLNPLVNDSYDDLDSDGLHNLLEHELGTSPIDTDTDSDLASDAWEVLHNFDPLDATDGSEDADGDGLANCEEEHFGTDPYESDTDQDGFSDLWETLNDFNPVDPNVPFIQHVVANTGFIIAGVVGITVTFAAGYRYLLSTEVRAHKRRLREEEEEIRRTFEELVNRGESKNSEQA